MSKILKSVPATISPEGTVTLDEPLPLLMTSKVKAMVVIVLEDEGGEGGDSLQTTLLSEDALGEDWNRSEEDEAWAYLQKVI